MKAPTRTLDLRFRKLRALPALPETVEVLELEGNNLGKVPSLEWLESLRELGMASANVKTIGTLPGLERLDLRYNEKLVVPKLPTTLRELRFRVAGSDPDDRLRLTSLALPNLEVLQLDGLLTELPSEIANHAKLETLEITGNQFRELRLALPKLQRLELEGLGYLAKPPALELPALRHLKFSGENSSSNDPDPDTKLLAPVWKLRLETLEIGGWEHLKKLPDFDVSALRRLELASTGITKLPKFLFGAKQLEHLDLRFMELADGEIEKVLAALPNVSLRVDEWPDTSEPPKKLEALLRATEIHHQVWYAKGAKQLAMVRAAVEAAFEVIDAADGVPAAKAQYAALRYGLVALEHEQPVKIRAQLLARLVELARSVLAALPEKIAIRSELTDYQVTVRCKAAAILVVAAAERGELIEALRYADLADEDHDYYGSTAPQRARIAALVKLDRTDEAARYLRTLIGAAKDRAEVQALKSAAWYRAASTV